MFRALVTTVILLTALVAVVGAFVVANDPIDSMSWGPVLLAAALLVLAVLTGVPALNAGAQTHCLSSAYSTVTDLARLRGLSMSWPSASAAW